MACPIGAGRMSRRLCLGMLAIVVAGCGRKGALSLPEPEPALPPPAASEPEDAEPEP